MPSFQVVGALFSRLKFYLADSTRFAFIGNYSCSQPLAAIQNKPLTIKMKIERPIIELKSELEILVKANEASIEQMIENLRQLSTLTAEFEKNWAGGWGERTYNYYKNFLRNGSDPHIVVSDEDIFNSLEKRTDIYFDKIRDATGLIVKENIQFQEKLVTELSVIKGMENLGEESELLQNIENHNWATTPMEYIKMRRPKTLMTYNPSELLSKGLSTPPHIAVGGELVSVLSMLVGVQNFQKNVKRLLRQLEIKLSIEDYSVEKTDFIVQMIERFHITARQILNRHAGRPTLEISDEYDVQDLMHGLLKLQFDDVRAEEYTPSYAGSSTRMDFLLKKEKIVIEVKKTRDSLKDKEIGEQLILDAQHYKSHPDCKKLICFVYDPDSRVKNPRGLENDLKSLSSDTMIVEIYIRP